MCDFTKNLKFHEKKASFSLGIARDPFLGERALEVDLMTDRIARWSLGLSEGFF
jgi:hypothetical protein